MKKNDKKKILSLRGNRFFKHLLYLVDQIIIFLYINGIKSIFAKKALHRLNEEQKNIVNRKLLVREIKSGKYLSKKNPIWFQHSIEKLMIYYQKYRMLIGIFIKIFISILVIVFPISFFVLVRGILPVPDRIKNLDPKITLLKTTLMKADSLIDVGIDGFYEVSNANKYLKQDNSHAQNAEINRYKISTSPVRTHYFKGYDFNTMTPLVFSKKKEAFISIRGQSYFKFTFFQMSEGSNYDDCEFEIRNEKSELIFQTNTRKLERSDFDSPQLGQMFQKRLIPGQLDNQNVLSFVKIKMDELPNKLIFTSKNMEESNDNKPSCKISAGNFLLERSQIEPLPQRGMIIILVDGLNTNLAYDYSIMPNLTNFWEGGARRYENHFSNSNEAGMAVANIFTGNDYRKIDPDLALFHQGKYPSLLPYKNLPMEARKAGYRTVAIGSIGSEDLDIWNEAIEIKNKHYETRSITEEAQNWLELNGDTPFVMYLHYSVLDPPFRPPFADLNLKSYTKSVFGLNGERELQLGVARFFDREFGLLQKKLSLLGISGEVAEALVGAYGIQMKRLDYSPILDITEKGATRSRSVLTAEEIHVPLLVQNPASEKTGKLTFNCYTEHKNIPTIFGHILGLESYASEPAPNCDSKESEIFHFTEGEKMTGMLYLPRREATEGSMYITVLEDQNATFFSNSFPWRKKIKFQAGDVFSHIYIGASDKTVFSAEEDLEISYSLKRKLAKNAPFSMYFQFTMLNDNDIDIDFLYKTSTGSLPKLPFPVQAPPGLYYNYNTNAMNTVRLSVTGKLMNHQNFIVPLQWNEAKLDSLESKSGLSFYGCRNPFEIEGKILLEFEKNTLCLLNTPDANILQKSIVPGKKGVLVKEIWGDFGSELNESLAN